MEKILFVKPIVLRKSLDDMHGEEKEQALMLLFNKDVLIVGKNGFEIVPDKDAKGASVCFYGSEAVCIYRQMLGLPDVGIRKIDVNDIITAIGCYHCLYDILFFLRRVDFRNHRMNRLSEISAPRIILMNEYRMLREYVEYLQDNNWCDRPMTCEFEDEDENGNPEHCEEVRISLANIGYDLLKGSFKENK